MMQFIVVLAVAGLLYNNYERIKPYIPERIRAPLERFGKDVNQTVIHIHTLVLVLTMVYMIPGLDWIGFTFQYWFYYAALWTAFAGSCVTISANNGPPPIREGWGKCKEYLGKLSTGVEFQWLFYVLIFFSADPFFLVLLVPARRSFTALTKHIVKFVPHVPQLQAYKTTIDELVAKEPEVLLAATIAEVLLGWYLILGIFLFENKQFLVVLLYWQFLRMRYHAPRSKAVHEKAWGVIGEKVDPVVSKVPPVEKAVDMVKTYFKKPM
ncbi:unnamed protein product [Amoebophrya sp. A120]|nr:unnamed protein product [Amoebophrya sp. A120]|eukprot:GSA120T00014883001.1